MSDQPGEAWWRREVAATRSQALDNARNFQSSVVELANKFSPNDARFWHLKDLADEIEACRKSLLRLNIPES